MPDFIPDEAIPAADPAEVVQQYRRLVFKIANRYQNILNYGGAIDIDDLVQCGSMGVLEAQKTYKPEDGSFSGWSTFYIKKAIRRAIGFRQDGSISPDWFMERLDAPVPGADDITLQDTIADSTAPTPEEKAAEDSERDEIAIEVREAVERIKNAKQRECITRVYLDGQTTAEAAQAMGLSKKQVLTQHQHGKQALRFDQKLRRLANNYYYICIGVSRFNTTFTSATEQGVLLLEQDFDTMFGAGAFLNQDNKTESVDSLW